MPNGVRVHRPSKKELVSVLNEGVSRTTVARRYSVPWSTVWRWLRHYDLKFPSKSRLLGREMARLYVRDNLTTNEIAKRAGISQGGVRYSLRKAGVSLRSKYERISDKDKDQPFIDAGLTPLEPYINNLSPRLCQCKRCKQRVSPTRSNLTRGQGGCRYCSGKTVTEAKVAAVFRNASLEPLAPFRAAGKPLKCRCLNCRRIVYPRYNDLQQGQGGCRFCAGNVAHPINKAQLIKLYLRKRLTTGEIAEIHGVSSSTVQKYLHAYSIPPRTGHERYGCERPPTAVLQQWYVIDEKTTNEIGTLCNACSRTVGKWLREAGITLRPSGATHGIYRWKALVANPRLYHAPAYIYLVRYGTLDEGFLKVGIGRRNSRRLDNHRSAGAEVLQVRYAPLHRCYAFEQKIRHDFKAYKYVPIGSAMLGGKTECFTLAAPIKLNQYNARNVLPQHRFHGVRDTAEQNAFDRSR